MTDVKTDVVLYEVRDRIATLTLNRPDRLNAWTGGLARRYYSLLEDAAADPDVRVIVVTAAGRGWCAGADMDSLQAAGARATRARWVSAGPSGSPPRSRSRSSPRLTAPS